MESRWLLAGDWLDSASGGDVVPGSYSPAALVAEGEPPYDPCLGTPPPTVAIDAIPDKFERKTFGEYLFIEGTATHVGSVQVWVNDQPITTATVSGGEWITYWHWLDDNPTATPADVMTVRATVENV
jgi:hypothetical protein